MVTQLNWHACYFAIELIDLLTSSQRKSKERGFLCILSTGIVLLKTKDSEEDFLALFTFNILIFFFCRETHMTQSKSVGCPRVILQGGSERVEAPGQGEAGRARKQCRQTLTVDF